MYSTEDGSLELVGVAQNAGFDRWGPWTSVEYRYSADDTHVVAAIRSYGHHPAVVFEQRYVDGADNTSVGDINKLSSGFPGFRIGDDTVDLGYLAYGGQMVGDAGKKLGRWTADNFTIVDGLDGGVLALYNNGPNISSLIISPLNQFMSASPLHNRKRAHYHWGIMGGVKQVPKGFSSKTVIYYGNSIKAAFEYWGRAMRHYYNKLPHYRESDFTNNYLSYWSDNGAYYVNYYFPDGIIQNKTYEEGLLGYINYANKIGLPYRSIQYSVWWKQGIFGGDTLWEANPILLPHGIKSTQTPYAKQNGGKYNFAVEKLFSLPLEQQFWTDFFTNSSQWGMRTYMQDWMNMQFDQMSVMTDNVHVARQWLMQMGEGARISGTTIQYCMSLSRHVLQSLEIPAVTQVRASNDYQPNEPLQWRIGTSSLFAHAAGLAPYKDTFWSTTYQPGNYYHGSEPYPSLQSVVATLSGGPVGPGDMIGGSDARVIMKCCAADGLILKASQPALAIDAQLLRESFGGDVGVAGEVWTTYSDIGKLRFGIIFAADMHSTFHIGVTAAHFNVYTPDNLQRYITSKVYSNKTLPVDFSDVRPVALTPACTKTNFCLYYTTPTIYWGEKELLLIGELAKWVPMSPKRVTEIRNDLHDFTINLQGAAHELVIFHIMYDGVKLEFSCIMSESGTAVISLAQKSCTSN